MCSENFCKTPVITDNVLLRKYYYANSITVHLSTDFNDACNHLIMYNNTRKNVYFLFTHNDSRNLPFHKINIVICSHRIHIIIIVQKVNKTSFSEYVCKTLYRSSFPKMSVVTVASLGRLLRRCIPNVRE